jgi:signal transduction histidine kinase
VLFNLLDNAVKFTPKGGYARVSVDNLEDFLHIRVSDTGIGFPVGCGPTLFERFAQPDQSSTRAHGGLGMGLATAKALVELHGGALSAASDGPGLGATFTVTLPPAGPDPIAPGSSP